MDKTVIDLYLSLNAVSFKTIYICIEGTNVFFNMVLWIITIIQRLFIHIRSIRTKISIIDINITFFYSILSSCKVTDYIVLNIRRIAAIVGKA